MRNMIVELHVAMLKGSCCPFSLNSLTLAQNTDVSTLGNTISSIVSSVLRPGKKKQVRVDQSH